MDDLSVDNTVAEAKKEDVKVITSTNVGKGDSMREGMMMARNEILVFLDADIPDYPVDIVKMLTDPLIRDEADFVKSYFERQTGRIAEIMVKPMLEFFFPAFTAIQTAPERHDRREEIDLSESRVR